MVIVCPKCGFEHDVPDGVLGDRKRAKLKCARCRQVFVYEATKVVESYTDRSFGKNRGRRYLYFNLVLLTLLSTALLVFVYLRASSRWPFLGKPEVEVSSLKPFFVSTLSGDMLALSGTLKNRSSKRLEHIVFKVSLYDGSGDPVKSLFVCPGGLPSESEVKSMLHDEIDLAVRSSCSGSSSFSVGPEKRMDFFVPVPVSLRKLAYYSVSVLMNKKVSGGVR